MAEVAVLEEEPRTEPAAPCVNCQAEVAGAYCAQCGQRVRTEPLTLRHVGAQVLNQLFSLERGMLHTVVDLFRHPGRMVHDVLRGRTQPYLNPIRYFLVWITFAQLFSFWLGTFDSFARGWVASARSDGAGLDAQALAATIGEYYVLIAAVLVPLLALASRIVFRKRALTVAEHLVFHLYAAGHTALLWSIGLVLDALPGYFALIGTIILLGAVGWYIWTSAGFFGRTRLRGLGDMILTVLLAVVLHALGIALVASGLDIFTPDAAPPHSH